MAQTRKKKTAEDAPAAAAARSKKKRRLVPEGIAHVNASFNNTIVTITDPQGNVISWSTAAKCGYRGSRKSTPYAGMAAAEQACEMAKLYGMKTLQEVRVKGPGAGRESAVRALSASGLKVQSMTDYTGLAFGGCRPPKRRRV